MNNSRISFTPGEVSRYYAARFPELSQRGRRWRGVCPLHQGTRSSLSVDSETGRWTCFSQCGRGGSLIDFEMALTGTEFKAALAAVYGIVGRPLPDRIRMTRDDWRRVQEAREREERERREAFFFAEAAATMAEQALEILQTWDDERRVHAKLLEDLKADAVAVYRDWREYNPAMAAGLVAAGRNLDRRWQKTLLGFVEDMAAEGYPGAA